MLRLLRSRVVEGLRLVTVTFLRSGHALVHSIASLQSLIVAKQVVVDLFRLLLLLYAFLAVFIKGCAYRSSGRRRVLIIIHYLIVVPASHTVGHRIGSAGCG